MNSFGRPCPTGCGEPAPVGKAMCLPCWSRVPKSLQANVHRTWRAWKGDVGNPDKMRSYRSALDAATSAAA